MPLQAASVFKVGGWHYRQTKCQMPISQSGSRFKDETPNRNGVESGVRFSGAAFKNFKIQKRRLICVYTAGKTDNKQHKIGNKE